MKLYDVNNLEYLNGSEYTQISDYLRNIRLSREKLLLERYPDFRVKRRVDTTTKEYNENKFYYPLHFNIPHFDVEFVEMIVHKGMEGFFELNEFAFQLNASSKTMFHRKLWNDRNIELKDNFLNFVYNHCKKHQQNKEFDLLEETAFFIFEKSDSLFDYYKNFIYNDEYLFATLDDYRELFDQLVEKKIWLSKEGDLYKLYDNIEFDDVKGFDMKLLYHTGQLSNIDLIHIESVYKQRVKVLSSLTSKLNFIPVDDQNNEFNGMWGSPKIGNKVLFAPQSLIFYNS
jgi:hypothetical protein